MNIFEPLITYSSPSRIAFVRMPGDVGPRAGLGDAQSADPLALDSGDEEALLLLLCAEQVDGGRTMSVCTAKPMFVPPDPE